LTGIDNDLSNAQLFSIEAEPKYLEETSNFLEEGKALDDLPTSKKKVLSLKSEPFTIINEYLYKIGSEDILRICVIKHERESIINKAHA